MGLEKELDACKKVAVEAGNKIMSFYGDDELEGEKSEKGFKSPLTKADLEAHQMISDALKREFPEYGFLSEEGKKDLSRLEKEYAWIIDPLDGTKEFVNGIPDFTVNIALTKAGYPVLGVIYAPVKEELFWSTRGKGAFYEKKGKATQILVSSQDAIANAVIVTSRFHPSKKLLSFIQEEGFGESLEIGSSLKGCVVAEGKADAYLRFNPINEWDICAMNSIIIEAGGMMTDLQGKDLKYNKEDTLITSGFLVANKALHKKILSRIKKWID